jgi:acyl-CoA thioesterase-1
MLLRPWRHFETLAQIGMLAAVVQLLAVQSELLHAQAAPPLKIVALGDSLTAGFRLAPADAFPTQLERLLKAKGYMVEVVNAGVSGDTTAAGLERLDWAVPDGTAAVILELGANDALRGLPPKEARRNLETILDRLNKKRVRVLVAGMMAPRNWGAAYAKEFDAMYRELATKHGADLYPFFLDGVALKPGYTLEDGMHPNREGVAEIARRMLPAVELLISEAQATRSSSGGASRSE